MLYHPFMQDERRLQDNKAAVTRFNREVIEQGNEAAFAELMDPEFLNRTAPPGMPAGPEGMLYMFNHVLRPALSELTVTIFDQLAEGDRVTTRKAITGIHTGPLLGVAATNRRITIEVIDIVRLKNGRYVEHWGINTLPSVLAALKAR
jgi:predicted ester cyclase